MSDWDEIRKEVAVKHGFVLDEDDPVLVTVTLNKLMLRDYIEHLNSQNEAHQRAFSAALDEGVEKSITESRKVAARIVNDGSAYVVDQCKTAIAEAMAIAVVQARAEIKNELVNSKKSILDLKISAFINGAFTVTLLLAVSMLAIKVFL